MKLKIKNYISESVIEFTAKIGNGIGIINKKVIQNKEFDAEIDINQILEIGKNTTIVVDDAFFIQHFKSENRIQGCVEFIDDDGMIFLRLSEDCLVMVENKSENIKIGNFLLLSIDFNNLGITPF